MNPFFSRFSSTLVLILLPLAAMAQSGDRYALLIGGLGGSAEHTEKFKGYLFETQKALVESYQFDPAHVVVLGETAIEDEPYVKASSLAENIRAEFAALAASVTPDDEVIVVLFGHGGYDNGEARLNIPRRDLSQQDFAELVGSLDAGRTVFIHTGSASQPFIEALSGSGRIVVTATRTGTQKNETRFPSFLIDALTSPAADQDKDSRVSVAELYRYASEKTAQWFDDNGHIPTENALLDDNGDGEGHRLEELEEAGDGNLAAVTYLAPEAGAAAIAANQGNPQAAGWLREKSQIEQNIAELKSRKNDLSVDDYYAQMEVLFVRLARGNEEMERQQ
jgi:hypothetical protein